jgi:hypothetical protein
MNRTENNPSDIESGGGHNGRRWRNDGYRSRRIGITQWPAVGYEVWCARRTITAGLTLKEWFVDLNVGVSPQPSTEPFKAFIANPRIS